MEKQEPDLASMIRDDIRCAAEKIQSGVSFCDLSETEKIMLKLTTRQVGISDAQVIEYHCEEGSLSTP